MKNIYDTVIVGSGSAGSILANRLSNDSNRNILLIEAGNDYSNEESIPENIYYGHGNLDLPASYDSDPHNWSYRGCLLYTSPSPRDKRQSRMPSSA